MIEVEQGNGDKHRETPLPGELKNTIMDYAEQRDAPTNHPLVDVSTRTLRDWTEQAADRCRASTSDTRWKDTTI